MSEKTPKQEALELLSIFAGGNDMTYDQKDRFHYLTALQVGLNAFHSDQLEYMHDRDWSFSGHWAGDGRALYLPEYMTSVDACLVLPLPERCIWKLFRVDDLNATAHVLYRPDGKPSEDKAFGRGATLAIAMLKAWWSIQPGSGK